MRHVYIACLLAMSLALAVSAQTDCLVPANPDNPVYPGAPGTPVVTLHSDAGNSTYAYVIVARDGCITGPPSAAGSIANGLATGASNTITWTAATNATSYDVYRTIGGGRQGRIANVQTLTFTDNSLPADGLLPPAQKACSARLSSDWQQLVNDAVYCVGWLDQRAKYQGYVSMFSNAAPAGLLASGGGGGLVRANLTGSLTPAAIESSVSDVANELFSLIVEIAVDRARREGLALVHDKLAELVCGLKFQIPGIRIVPGEKPTPTVYQLVETCKLVTATDLQALVKQGVALRAAITNDLINAAGAVVTATFQKEPPLAAGAVAGLSLVSRLVTQPGTKLTANDGWLVASAIVNAEWTGPTPPGTPPNAQIRYLKYAVAVGRAYIQAMQWAGQVDPSQIDLTYVVQRVVCQGVNPCQAWTDLGTDLTQKQRVFDWAGLAVKTIAASRGDGTDDVKMRLRSALQLVFDSLIQITVSLNAPADSQKAAWIRSIALAAIDEDVAHLIAALAETAREIITPATTQVGAAIDTTCSGACLQQRKVSALLSAIAQYASTYTKIPSGATPDQIVAIQQQQHDERKAALESVIDAAADRRSRAGDWVFSIGTAVGFSYNGLKFSRKGLDNSFGSGQLHVPLGVGFQKLPGSRVPLGFSAMGSVLDLGNYVRQKNDPNTKLDWKSILGPGVHVGLAIGKPNAFFVIGGAVTYSPHFADVTSPAPVSASATKYGFFVHYYLSLWDIN